MPFGIGPVELLLLLLVALLVFGPKRLPQMARSLGSGLREVKESVSTIEAPLEDDEEPSRPALPAAPAQAPAQPAAPAAPPRADTTPSG